MPVIEVENLHKRYGKTVAVDGVSFHVEEGEIFGMLGRNGAGKTTMVECIEGLRRPDSGSVRVLGLRPGRDRAALTQRMGAQLLEMLGLGDKRDTYYRKLSGGQKQRLSIALALIGSPEVAVLDELTTGLDPQARRDTWDLIETVRERGVTIVLVLSGGSLA